MIFVRMIAIAAVAILSLVGFAEAKGSFGGRSSVSGFRTSGTARTAPSYSAPRPATPAPAISVAPKTSVPSVPMAAPAPAAPKPAVALPAGGFKVNIPPRSYERDGGRFNSAFAPSYNRFGYEPTPQQNGIFGNPWFWMYMMNGHPSPAAPAAAPVAAPAAPAASQQDFEMNCKAAAAREDKPADLEIKSEDCADLARLAFAKVRAEAEPAKVVPAPKFQPVVESGWGFGTWVLIFGGLLMAVGVGMAVFNRARSF